jgi:hypothetical protein
MMKALTLGQILILVMLTFLGVLPGLIYFCYLGITYRMDLLDPIEGPKLRARIAAKQAAADAELQARRAFGLRMIKSPLFWGPIAGFLVVRFCMVNF